MLKLNFLYLVALLGASVSAQSLDSLISTVQNSCWGNCWQSVLENLCPSDPTWSCACADQDFSAGYESAHSSQCLAAADTCGISSLDSLIPTIEQICVDELTGSTSGSSTGTFTLPSPTGEVVGSSTSTGAARALHVGWTVALAPAVAAFAL